LISNLGWTLYVKIAWRKNISIQQQLDDDIRDNLGWFLDKQKLKDKESANPELVAPSK